jgi:hypothetical protein
VVMAVAEEAQAPDLAAPETRRSMMVKGLGTAVAAAG